MSDMNDLPEEVRAEMASAGASVDNQKMLDTLSEAVAKKRDAARMARQALGCEKVWQKCEDAYMSIDNANRPENSGQQFSKPTTMQGPLTAATPTEANGRSTVFIPITRRYVDAGTAKVCDIILPADDKSFSFSAIPAGELIKQLEDTTQVMLANGQPAERDAKPGEVPGLDVNQYDPANPPGVPLLKKDLAEEAMATAERAAQKAEDRIYGWMVETGYRREMRKVVFDMARLGVGVLKGPFPFVSRAKAIIKSMQDAGMVLEMVEKLIPSQKWVSPWNIYPDPACGENIQDGSYCFELDSISETRLEALKGQPGFIDSQIDKVIKEGPNKSKLDEYGNPNNNPEAKKAQFEIWYMEGLLKREELEATGVSEADFNAKNPDGKRKDFFAVVTLVNSVVIRAVLSPVQASNISYRNVSWSRRAGSWAGIGVAEQIDVPQRMLNGVTRAMNNNAGKSAGVITVINRGQLEPSDNNWAIGQDKLFYTADDATLEDINKSIMFYSPPNRTAELMTMAEYAFRLAEEATSIPLISQGLSGTTTPDTFGAAQLQNNNANQLLRAIAMTIDDHITEPYVNAQYEWLLMDPDVPAEEKGQFKIDAHGSAALVERAVQDQTIMNMAAIVKDPAYGINPKLWAKQMIRSKHMRPEDFAFTEAELEEQKKNPPIPIPVQVAQVRAASDEKRMQQDTDRDTVYVNAERERNQSEHEARMAELNVKRELAMLDYANKRELTLEQVKASLAETAMKMNLQRELNANDRHHDMAKSQVLTPPVEPAGRAPAGEAFAQ